MSDVAVLLVDARPGPDEDVAAALARVEGVVHVEELVRLGSWDHAVAVEGGEDVVEGLLEDLPMVGGVARVQRAPHDDPAREAIRDELDGG